MNSSLLPTQRPLNVADIERTAHRLPLVLHADSALPLTNGPSLEGVLLGQEVQFGLFATGYDVRFLEDISLDESVEPSILCAVPLSGNVSPMSIDGFGEVSFAQGDPVLLGFGQEGRCRTNCRAGQKCAVAGFTLCRSFLDRIPEIADQPETTNLARMLDEDFTAVRLSNSTELKCAAVRLLDPRYSGSLARLHLESSTLAFLVEAARLLTEMDRRPDGMSKRHYDQVVRARDLLDADIAFPPSIEELTKEAGVNATTLRANFLKAFGTTIFGHVRNRRLEVAQFLLRTHDLSIAEVAYRVGFTNAGAFSTAYNKHYGHPPRQDSSRRRQ